jgi:hypothetical protein
MIRADVIDTLLSVADPATSSLIIAEHASSLVTTMLKNSKANEMPSAVSNGIVAKSTCCIDLKISPACTDCSLEISRYITKLGKI